jgi:hypothetical protein
MDPIEAPPSPYNFHPYVKRRKKKMSRPLQDQCSRSATARMHLVSDTNLAVTRVSDLAIVITIASVR